MTQRRHVPRHMSVGKHVRPLPEALAARTATYVLHAEPGRFDLIGGELDVPAHWLGRVLELAAAAGGELDVVAELRSRVLTGLRVLRSGHATGPEMRASIEDAIVAALALGFHHSGGLVAAIAIEKAASDTRKQGTAAARGKLSREPRRIEGAKAKAMVQAACHEIWERDPAILQQRAWVRATIQKINDRVIEDMRPYVAPGSKWEKDSKGLTTRMKNHVKAAFKTFRQGFERIG